MSQDVEPTSHGDSAPIAEQYAPESVGSIMTPHVTALQATLTVADAMAELRRLSDELELRYYVYVVDPDKRLLGVLSMRDVILANPARRLAEIMRKAVTRIRVNDDQEEAARLIAKTNFLALPVVDDAERLLGIVTVDDVLDVLVSETTEDMQVMFGAGAGERLDTPWHTSVRQRLPWLLVNLGLATAGAAVIGLFESTIAALAVLAIYLPVVAGMGGNATAQAMAVAIRAIAVGDADAIRLRRVARRQVFVGLLIGLLTGAIAAGVAWLFHAEHGKILGLIIAAAMTLNLAIGCLWGLTVPFLMRRLGFDPAQSATIFTTTVTDLVGFLLVLSMAKLWM